MAIVNINNILEKAQKEGYAIGAFNVYNVQDTAAVIEAAIEVNSPVILSTSTTALNHAGAKDLSAIIRRRATEADIPICLHLDHAENFETIVKTIYAGYTSVMYDGSLLSYEENVENTREVVKVATPADVSVEAEIGRVGKSEESEDVGGEVLSIPKEVERFVEDTNIDACAIAIGSQHGMQKQEANLDFKRLEDIRERIETPLVLHGSSGVVESELRKVGEKGIQKVNIGTRLKRVFTDKMRIVLSDNEKLHNHVQVFEEARKAVKEEVIHKIKILGSDGKA